MELPWESWEAFPSKLWVQQRSTLQAQSGWNTSWEILVSITAPTFLALIHPFLQVMERLEALGEAFPLGSWNTFPHNSYVIFYQAECNRRLEEERGALVFFHGRSGKICLRKSLLLNTFGKYSEALLCHDLSQYGWVILVAALACGRSAVLVRLVQAISVLLCYFKSQTSC